MYVQTVVSEYVNLVFKQEFNYLQCQRTDQQMTLKRNVT